MDGEQKLGKVVIITKVSLKMEMRMGWACLLGLMVKNGKVNSEMVNRIMVKEPTSILTVQGLLVSGKMLNTMVQGQ